MSTSRCPRLAHLAAALISALTASAAAPPAPESVYAWYAGDTSLVVGADGYGISAWSNLGTAATNATYTQGKRHLNRLVGTPQKVWLVRADGSPAAAMNCDGNDALWAAQSDFGALAAGRTIVACVRAANATSQGFLFDSSSYVTGLTRAQVNGGRWQVSVYGAGSSGAAGAPGTATAPVLTNTWQVHTFRITTGTGALSFRHFIDGAEAGTVSNSVAGALGGLIVGANASAALGFRGDVAEFLVFNSALDDATRAGIEGYLSAKWAGVGPDPNAPAPPVPPRFVPVFTGGVDGYTCFRIPALVTTTKGTVLAIADGRIGSCGDIPTPLDLVCKRSFDNGETWGPLQVIANYGSDPNDKDTYPFYKTTNIVRVAAGDAALLLDRTNGRIWTLYDNGGVVGTARKIKLELRFSDDDGATWSDAIDLEAQNPGLRPATGEFLAGPGNGIQMTEGPQAGRLIFPVYVYGSPSSSMAIYSDDHGATWRRSGTAGAGGGEVQMAETAGGGLLASMRDNDFATSGVRTFSHSADGGATWGTPYTSTPGQPALPDPACQASLLRLTTIRDSNASRLVHANAAHASSRVNLTLRISYDEGQTWAVSNQVYAGGSAYSALTGLATGEVGLLFEKDPYGNIVFVRRSLSQITSGADSLPAYTVWAGDHFSPLQLTEIGISGPEADPDADALNNNAEFIAGTNPLDPLSRLDLQLEPRAAILHFTALSNRSYSLQRRDAPASGPWQRFADFEPSRSNSVVTVPFQPTNDAGSFRLATPRLPQ